MICYIYVLKCPFTLIVKYVGKTNNPQLRWNQHKSDSRTKICKLKSWIISLKRKNTLPIFEIIDTCNSNEWKTREMIWINKFKSDGIVLKNMTGGGDGATTLSDEMKSYLSKIKMGKKLNYSHPKRRIVSCYDFDGKLIEAFNFLNEAYLKYKYHNCNIISAIKRGRTAYGYQWRYGKVESIDSYRYYKPNNNKVSIALHSPVIEIDINGNHINR